MLYKSRIFTSKSMNISHCVQSKLIFFRKLTGINNQSKLVANRASIYIPKNSLLRSFNYNKYTNFVNHQKRNLLQCKHYFSTSNLSFENIDPNDRNLKGLNNPQSDSNLDTSSSENEFGISEGQNLLSIRQLLGNMTIDQRREILLELQLEEAAERRKEAEEKLASWHWRSKFGRPASIHPPAVDPSGTYCEIPQDWLMKKVAESSKPQPPTFTDLRKIAVFNALPFVGFGFLDNFIMIVAGDYIDLTIGIYLGISTMAAAALGNTISDLAGIGSAWYVEFLSAKIGVRPPDLSQEQQDMASSRWSANIGRGVGVCMGCILGMFPLLILSNHSRVDRQKKSDEDS